MAKPILKIIHDPKKRAKLLKDKAYKYPNKVEVEDLRDDYDIDNEEDFDLLLNNFPHFLAYVYPYLNFARPTPIQNRIANILGYYFNANMILEAGRGTGKSLIGSILQPWVAMRDPDEKTMIIGATAGRAYKISKFIRTLYDEVDLLKEISPSHTEKSGTINYDIVGASISIEPSVSAVGVEAQIVGARSSFVLADDVEIPQNSATEEARAKIKTVIEELENLMIPEKESKVLMLGTPQSMESVYNKLPYNKIIIPSEVPEEQAITQIYEGWLDEWVLLQGVTGDAVDQARFPEEELDKRKFNPSLFKLQYMLDTSLADAEKYPLKTKDLIMYPLDSSGAPEVMKYASKKELICDELPNIGFTGDLMYEPFETMGEYAPFYNIQMHIDVSARGGDETAWVIVGLLNGRLHLLDWDGYIVGDSPETFTAIAMKAAEWEVNEVIPEGNYGGGMWTRAFAPYLQTLHPSCHLTEDYLVKGRKEFRINNAIAPLIKQHKIIMNRDRAKSEIEWVLANPGQRSKYSLLWQMTHFEFGVKDSIPHDDRLDALANAADYNQDGIGANQDDMLENARLRMIEKDIEEARQRLTRRHVANASKARESKLMLEFGRR